MPVARGQRFLQNRDVRVGIVRQARRPAGWVAPGPAPAGPQDAEDLWPAAGEDLCFLAGDFRIFQEQRGHRWSLDDLVTAFVAARAFDEVLSTRAEGERGAAVAERSVPGAGGAAEPARLLDLGSGIGSVLLMLAWRFPAAGCTGIEAQERSVGLARRSMRYDGVADRCATHLADFRDAAVLPADARFDLVTGTPPYLPVGAGVESERPQCGPCRFEHRGGVEDYCLAAARWLAPDGLFVMCAGAGQTERVQRGAAAAGLEGRGLCDVVPRAGKPALLRVFTFASGPGPPLAAAREQLVVRGRDGQWTEPYAKLRLSMGLPPGTYGPGAHGEPAETTAPGPCGGKG